LIFAAVNARQKRILDLKKNKKKFAAVYATLVAV
jgi:hypothetical protein